MPTFYIHFSDGRRTHAGEIGMEFTDLEQAYLEVCAAIPDGAKDLLIKRQDPLAASYSIADAKGRILMTVPFTDVLSPSEWKLAKARRRPVGGPRSIRARNDLALSSFRRMFGSANAGCVLLTPEMHIVEMNAFGARHSHVNAEAVRGMSIFGIFSELRGEPAENFHKFMSLAQSGAVSEVTDLPYLVQDTDGQTAMGFGMRERGRSSMTMAICLASSNGRSRIRRLPAEGRPRSGCCGRNRPRRPGRQIRTKPIAVLPITGDALAAVPRRITSVPDARVRKPSSASP